MDENKDSPKEVERDANGRFIGSGNPSGRTEGSRNKQKAPSQDEWLEMIGSNARLAHDQARKILQSPKASEATKAKVIALVMTEYTKALAKADVEDKDSLPSNKSSSKKAVDGSNVFAIDTKSIADD